MRDLIVVTNMSDDTQATLTVTKLTRTLDEVFINAYPFHIPSLPIRVGQYIKAKHYPDPHFTLTTVYKGQIKGIENTKLLCKLHIQLKEEVKKPIERKKTLIERMAGVFKSLGC